MSPLMRYWNIWRRNKEQHKTGRPGTGCPVYFCLPPGLRLKADGLRQDIFPLAVEDLQIEGNGPDLTEILRRMSFIRIIFSFLSVDVHSRHIGFTVTLHHAEKFPTVALIEAGVVGNKI